MRRHFHLPRPVGQGPVPVCIAAIWRTRWAAGTLCVQLALRAAWLQLVCGRHDSSCVQAAGPCCGSHPGTTFLHAEARTGQTEQHLLHMPSPTCSIPLTSWRLLLAGPWCTPILLLHMGRTAFPTVFRLLGLASVDFGTLLRSTLLHCIVWYKREPGPWLHFCILLSYTARTPTVRLCATHLPLLQQLRRPEP